MRALESRFFKVLSVAVLALSAGGATARHPDSGVVFESAVTALTELTRPCITLPARVSTQPNESPVALSRVVHRLDGGSLAWILMSAIALAVFGRAGRPGRVALKLLKHAALGFGPDFDTKRGRRRKRKRAEENQKEFGSTSV